MGTGVAGPSRVAVVGPGAMGCLFGALLAEAGHEVWLVDHRPDRAATLTASGITVEGIGDTRTVPIRATADPSTAGPFDSVILTVKAHDTQAAALACLPLAGPQTAFVTLQNGLGNVETLAATFGPERVVAGATGQGATLLGPGHVMHAGEGDTVLAPVGGISEEGYPHDSGASAWQRLASPPNPLSRATPTAAAWERGDDASMAGRTDRLGHRGTHPAQVPPLPRRRAPREGTGGEDAGRHGEAPQASDRPPDRLSEPDGPVRESLLLSVEHILRSAGLQVTVADDWNSVIWSKVVLNCAINPITALMRLSNGQLTESPDLRDLLIVTAREAAEVARACGAKLNYSDVGEEVIRVCERTAANQSSMLQDIIAGRITEIDALNGAVAREAQARGLDAPINRTLAALVRGLCLLSRKNAVVGATGESPNAANAVP